MRAGLDTCAQLNAIDYEKAKMLGHPIRPYEDYLVGVNKTIVKPRGQIDCDFFFVGGMKTFHETFVVLNDPQPFDVILSDDFIHRNNLIAVNERFFPLRKLTKGMLLITSQNQ